jgi:hypothetical protein
MMNIMGIALWNIPRRDRLCIQPAIEQFLHNIPNEAPRSKLPGIKAKANKNY